MPVKLKPCPFCGERKDLFVPHEGVTYQVYCDNCTSHGPWKLSRNGAIAVWNRRSTDDTRRT